MSVSEYPHIPEGWSIKPLIDCTEDQVISYGIVQPGSNVEDGIPIVRVNNFTDNGLDLSSVLRVAPSVEEKYARTRLKGGEVLLTLVGSTGQSIVAPLALNGWNVPRAIAVIRPTTDIGATWVNICLQSQATKNFLDARANTTVQKTLNLKDVRQIPVLIPPRKTKQFIESAISTLDDKIELNRQMNATLEAMAQALFKSWFVDFDPVIDNALAAGHPIPEPLHARAEARKALGDQRRPLPEAIQEQFPNRFVFNEEMGWVPEGWEVLPLNSLIELIGGGTPKTSIEEYWDGEIPWFSVVDAPTQSDVFVLKTEKRISPAGLENSSAKLLPVGTTIISARGTVGKCAIVGEPMAMNQSCYGIKGSSGYSDYYIYYTILLRVADLQQRGHGSVFNTITRDTFRSIKTVACPSDLSCSFDETVRVNMERMITNLREADSLAAIRDTLLPKLLSGQLPIPDAEKQLAEAI